MSTFTAGSWCLSVAGPAMLYRRFPRWLVTFALVFVLYWCFILSETQSPESRAMRNGGVHASMVNHPGEVLKRNTHVDPSSNIQQDNDLNLPSALNQPSLQRRAEKIPQNAGFAQQVSTLFSRYTTHATLINNTIIPRHREPLLQELRDLPPLVPYNPRLSLDDADRLRIMHFMKSGASNLRSLEDSYPKRVELFRKMENFVAVLSGKGQPTGSSELASELSGLDLKEADLRSLFKQRSKELEAVWKVIRKDAATLNEYSSTILHDYSLPPHRVTIDTVRLYELMEAYLADKRELETAEIEFNSFADLFKEHLNMLRETDSETAKLLNSQNLVFDASFGAISNRFDHELNVLHERVTTAYEATQKSCANGEYSDVDQLALARSYLQTLMEIVEKRSTVAEISRRFEVKFGAKLKAERDGAIDHKVVLQEYGLDLAAVTVNYS
ncbi:hypothetical protein BKA69DRAFT_1086383, partial [Paraphysoderma sedebokerense]